MPPKVPKNPTLKLTPRLKQSVKPTPKPPPAPKPAPKTKSAARAKVAAKPKVVAKPSTPAKAKAKAKAPAKAKPTPVAESKVVSPEFQAVLDALADTPGVTRPKMFGHNGLALGGKFFAIDWRGHLVVKLARADVDAMVGKGVGVQFDPGMGRPMKEWVQVAPGVIDWVRLAERSLDFVGGQLAN